MGSAMLRSSRWTVLLSLNAAAILIAGVLIAGAIWFNGGIKFHVVNERTDVANDEIDEVPLLSSTAETGSSSSVYVLGNDDYLNSSSHEYDSSTVPDDELWNEKSIVIYATPDVDVCVGGGLTDLGDMYWQTSDQDVISGFYNSSRTWLGYSNETCKYPIIKGTGTTTITAGTYDGNRKDSILVTVVEPPVAQWEHDVLTLVNKIRIKNDLEQLTWGETCEDAAKIRAEESKTTYSHIRPDGTSWSTVCAAPNNNGTSGENLAIGNAAVSPATVVALWMSSDSHRANILNPEYTKLAVGFVFDPDSTYRTYWSQFFSTY